MKTATFIARNLLGLIFLVFGLNGFYTFIPVPVFHPFMEIMVESGFIYIEKAIEVAGGILLLLNRYMLAAILILGPVIMNILMYHLLIDQRNWVVAIVLTNLYMVLIIRYWRHFKIFLLPKVE